MMMNQGGRRKGFQKFLDRNDTGRTCHCSESTEQMGILVVVVVIIVKKMHVLWFEATVRLKFVKKRRIHNGVEVVLSIYIVVFIAAGCHP